MCELCDVNELARETVRPSLADVSLLQGLAECVDFLETLETGDPMVAARGRRLVKRSRELIGNYTEQVSGEVLAHA